jgi:hypothetical protein
MEQPEIHIAVTVSVSFRDVFNVFVHVCQPRIEHVISMSRIIARMSVANFLPFYGCGQTLALKESRMSPEFGSGAGSSLPLSVLVLSGLSTLVAVLVSAMSIYLQLKNYRKPVLQRCASLKNV